MFRALACLMLLSLPLSSFGQQGNYKYNQYGNRSILLTGNVTGSVTDIGLTYYNPSRLSLIENNGFAFNARAYQYNSLKVDPLITDGDPISKNSLTGVPSLVGGTFNLFNERFGYVFLSKYRLNRDISTTYTDLNENILNEFPEALGFSTSTSLANDIRDDWYGLSWAKKFNQNFSVGISVFGSYYKYRGLRSLNRVFQFETDQVSSEQYQYSFDQRSYGLHFKIGADYKVDNLDFGININLPYLEVISRGNYNLLLIKAGSVDSSDAFYDYEFEDVKAQRRIPYGVSAGAGIKLAKSRIHLNIDYMSNLKEYQRLDLPSVDLGGVNPSEIIFNEKRRHVFNFGVGGELFINDNFSTLFGFTTDFDSLQGETNFFDFSTTNADELSAGTNYYHFSGGIDWTLKWASIILGITYSTGSNDISIVATDIVNVPGTGVANNSKVKSRRVQLVIGFEIPFIESGMKSFKEKVKLN